MTTRIPSVFRLLKRVGFAVLLLGGNATAQPLEVLWERQGLAFNSGYAIVCALGDQNGDGFADWSVGAPSSDAPAQSYVELFYGGDPPSQQPYRTFVPMPDSTTWVFWTVSLGDINGDSLIDFALYRAVSPGHYQYAIYFGGGDPDRAPDMVLDYGPVPLNRAIVGIGDFNGDGFDDVLNYTLDGETTVHYIYFGSSEFDLIPDWQVSNIDVQSHYPRSWGDINGDGYVDLLNVDWDSQRLYAFWGSENPDSVRQVLPPLPEQLSHPFVVPDATGDAAAEILDQDVIVPLERYQIAVWFGGNELGEQPNVYLSTYNDTRVDHYQGIGDINGDGFSDFVALTNQSNQAWGGVLSIYLGYQWLNPDPFISIPGPMLPYSLIGPTIATALGDVNDDGMNDFAIGATSSTAGNRRGKTIVFSGDSTFQVSTGRTAPILVEEFNLKIAPNPFNSSARLKFDVPFTAQEIDLRIYNVLGEQVITTTVQPFAGQVEYIFTPDAALASGLYIACAQAESHFISEKLLFMK